MIRYQECHKFQGIHKQKQLNLISCLQTHKEVFKEWKDTWNSSLKPNWSIGGHYFALWGRECAHFGAGVSHGPAWTSCGSVCHEHTSHNTWTANTWVRAERPCHLANTKRYNTPLAIFWTELDSFKLKEWDSHGLLFILSWLVFIGLCSFCSFWRSPHVKAFSRLQCAISKNRSKEFNHSTKTKWFSVCGIMVVTTKINFHSSLHTLISHKT